MTRFTRVFPLILTAIGGIRNLLEFHWKTHIFKTQNPLLRTSLFPLCCELLLFKNQRLEHTFRVPGAAACCRALREARLGVRLLIIMGYVRGLILAQLDQLRIPTRITKYIIMNPKRTPQWIQNRLRINYRH